ncbi:MAG: NADH-quinone oxidoreductase subunit NuoH [Actinomycetota bacterium]|nr:NADH-quinone oxidoreductase subunit NuoH [Actinomycetota bacterium]
MGATIQHIFANTWVLLALKLSVLLILLPATLVLGWVELKLGAHMQHRMGPMYPGGFHGWAQTLADGLKFVMKEDIIPTAADRPVFSMVPFITMLGASLTFVVIPLSPHVAIEKFDVGIFYVLAVSSIGVIGVLMAGWSSANKYSLMGALRAAAQLIAYELPLVLTAAAVAMQAGSLSLIGIVEAQRHNFFNLGLPNVLWFQPLGFFIFLTAGTAELTRPPFDMPVAEAELITGAFTEYTGIRFAFSLFAAEYIALIGLAALGTTLFLGGYLPPIRALGSLPIPGFVWFFGKMATILFVLIWIRWTFPRLREDQLQKFAWKVLIPLSLLNILITGALKLTPWM